MQGTIEQLKSVETQQLASKLDGQVQAAIPQLQLFFNH
jgi:hypothetical protein